MQTNSGFSANADVVTSNSDTRSVLNIHPPWWTYVVDLTYIYRNMCKQNVTSLLCLGYKHAIPVFG